MPSLEGPSGIDIEGKTVASPEASASDAAASIEQELKLLAAEQSLRLQKKPPAFASRSKQSTRSSSISMS